MEWGNRYCSNRTIEDERKDYEEIHKMIAEYDSQINAIDAKIERLKHEFGKGISQRILTLEGMRNNLLYAYKGLCSNGFLIRA